MKRSLLALVIVAFFAGCSDRSAPPAPPAEASGGAKLTPVTLVLNWVPEPEFGGFYAALNNGNFKKYGLDVTIKPGGSGTPTVQMVGAGSVEFGIASADEVLIARSRGNNIVGIFTGYQTCPQGIMTHKERGFTSLEDVFKRESTVAMEMGLAYGRFLKNKYGFEKVKVIPYAGGVAQFLSDKNLSQQCFVFSEPISAKKQGAEAVTFLVAESGYNPYTTVVVTKDEYLKANRALVAHFAQACREGWEAYLKDPAPTNKAMRELNKLMDEETFAAAAEAQKGLVESEQTKAHGIGSMTLERWRTLADQLVQLKVIEKAPVVSECFVSHDQPTP